MPTKDSSTASGWTTRTDCPTRPATSGGCGRLTGAHTWVVIEKILAVDEPLDPTLPVAGTTGYDALREIGGVLRRPGR